MDIGKHRRANEIALIKSFGPAGTADNHPRALRDSLLQQSLNLVILYLRHHRTDVFGFGIVIKGLAIGDSLGGVLCNLNGFFITRCGNEHSGGSVAGLSRITETTQHAAAHGGFHVGIIKEDVGRLAAEFLGHAFDGSRGGLRDQNPRAGRTGKGDHINARVPRHILADIGTRAVDKIENPCRNARFMENLGNDKSVQRRNFRGFQHHRATRRQCGRNLRGDLVERPIPRGNHSANANRFAGPTC